MFRPIRRKMNEISTEEAKQLLINERRGVLALHGDNGYPYAIPINFYFDEANNKIIFHGAKEGHKVDAITNCDKVCFTVYGNETIKEDKPWAPYMQSAIAFGHCRLINDEEVALNRIKQLAMKYYPNEETADKTIEQSKSTLQIFEIKIEHLTGKQIRER